MWRAAKPRRALTSTGNGTLVAAGRPAATWRGEPMPCCSKKQCAAYLSTEMSQASGSEATTVAPTAAKSSRRAVRMDWSRSVSGSTARMACCSHSASSDGDVAGRVDARHERLAIGQVERRREPARVGRHDDAAGPLARERGLERDDHVAAHAGAGEQDVRRRHRRAQSSQIRRRPRRGPDPRPRRRGAPCRPTPSTMNGSALTACSTRPAESATAGGTP